MTSSGTPPPPFLPLLQPRYMPNDLMTVRRPQPSIYIYANSVVKEVLGRVAEFAGFNPAHYFQKCAISRNQPNTTIFAFLDPLDLLSTFPRPLFDLSSTSLDLPLDLSLNIPPELFPILCNKKGLILIDGAN